MSILQWAPKASIQSNVSVFTRVGAKNGTIGDALAFILPRTGSVYIEPFGGSFGVGKRLGGRYPIRIYNDLEAYSLAVMRQITGPQAQLFYQKALQEIEYSPLFLKESIKQFPNETDPIKRGIYAWAILTLSYSGNGKPRDFPTPLCDKIRYREKMQRRGQIIPLLRGVQVTEQDAMDCIRQYDVAGSVIYADPPYVLKNTEHNRLYFKLWNTDEQNRFIDAVCAVGNASVLISGYDNNLYNDRLKGWWKLDIGEVSKTISRTKAGQKKPREHEIVWANYPLPGGIQL